MKRDFEIGASYAPSDTYTWHTTCRSWATACTQQHKNTAEHCLMNVFHWTLTSPVPSAARLPMTGLINCSPPSYDASSPCHRRHQLRRSHYASTALHCLLTAATYFGTFSVLYHVTKTLPSVRTCLYFHRHCTKPYSPYPVVCSTIYSWT